MNIRYRTCNLTAAMAGVLAIVLTGTSVQAQKPESKPTKASGVYTQTGETPRLPKSERLTLARSAGVLSASLELATESLGTNGSQDLFFGRNLMRTRRIYPRVTFRNFTTTVSKVTTKIEYSMGDGPRPYTKTESKESGEVKLGFLVVDFDGYQDQYGSSAAMTESYVTSSGVFTKHKMTTKNKMPLHSIRVIATGAAGEVLYDGIWRSTASR